MDFQLLGPFGVSHRGQPVAIGSGKRRALLALLLLHVDEPVTAEALIDGLWDGHPPATARSASRSTSGSCARSSVSPVPRRTW